MGKKVLLGTAVLLAAAAVATLLVVRPTKTATATAALQSFATTIDCDGTVAAPTQAVLLPMAGKVARVVVTEGQTIAVGDEVARMDDSLLALQLDEALTALNAAKRATQTVDASQGELRQAVAAAQTVSVDEEDVADAAQQAKQAETSANSQIDLARLKVSKAREQLENASVCSALAGEVLEVKVRAGQYATAGMAAATVAAMDELTIDAVVADLDVVGIQPGMAVELSGGCLGDGVCAGVVRAIKPLAQTQQTQSGSRSAAVVSIVPQERSLFSRLGASVDVKIVTANSQAVAIPLEALEQGSTGLYVYRVVNGRALRTPVEVGRLNDTSAEVLSGVALGDRVALVPSALKSGQRVRDDER